MGAFGSAKTLGLILVLGARVALRSPLKWLISLLVIGTGLVLAVTVLVLRLRPETLPMVEMVLAALALSVAVAPFRKNALNAYVGSWRGRHRRNFVLTFVSDTAVWVPLLLLVLVLVGGHISRAPVPVWCLLLLVAGATTRLIRAAWRPLVSVASLKKALPQKPKPTRDCGPARTAARLLFSAVTDSPGALVGVVLILALGVPLVSGWWFNMPEGLRTPGAEGPLVQGLLFFNLAVIGFMDVREYWDHRVFWVPTSPPHRVLLTQLKGLGLLLIPVIAALLMVDLAWGFVSDQPLRAVLLLGQTLVLSILTVAFLGTWLGLKAPSFLRSLILLGYSVLVSLLSVVDPVGGLAGGVVLLGGPVLWKILQTEKESP